MTSSAWKAIDRLRNARDELEYAARASGSVVIISKKVCESILDDLGVVARLVRRMAERGRE